MIKRLRSKVRGLQLTFMEHLELDELLAALEQEYSRLIQRINGLEQEVKALRSELNKSKRHDEG